MKVGLKRFVCGCFLSSLAIGAGPASAVVFTGSSGPLSAQAEFEVSGNDLVVRLTNTSAQTTGFEPADGLAAVFWDLPAGFTLTPVSALVPAGSQIVQSTTCSSGACAGATNVGGEFDYALTTSIAGADRGISSSGFGIFGSGSFGGANLDNPGAVNGMNFLVMPGGFDAGEGNGGMNDEPFIRDSVVFTLSGAAGLDPLAIGGVWFQYNADLNAPGFGGDRVGGGPVALVNGVPEPASLALAGLGLGAMVWRRRAAQRSRSAEANSATAAP